MKDILFRAAAHQHQLDTSISKMEDSTDFVDGPSRVGSTSTAFRYRLDSKHLAIIDDDILEKYRTNGSISAEKVSREYILADDGRHATYVPGALVQVGDASTSATWARKMTASPDLGGFLDEYVPIGYDDGASVIDLAINGRAQLAPAMESISGTDCYVIDVQGDHLQMRLWIAPSKDFSMAKVHVTGSAAPKLKKYDDWVDQIEFQQLNGVWFPWKGKFSGTVDYADSNVPQSCTYVTAQRQTLELTDKMDAMLFSLKHFANGTRAQFEDTRPSGIRYVWKDGYAVANVDRRVVDTITDNIAAYTQAQSSTASAQQYKIGGSALAESGSPVEESVSFPWISVIMLVAVSGTIGLWCWQNRHIKAV